MATPSGDILNRKVAADTEMVKECGEIEEAIAALRMSYEQYFIGMERRPPTPEHKDLKRRINQLKTGFVRQTAMKFRIQALTAKFLTYERLWTRTLQEMENGTYRRDLFKARLHAQERAKASGKAPVKEASGPGPGPAAPPPPSAANPGLSEALSDQRLKEVFQAYVTAKKRCQEDVSKLSFDQVAANLRKQVPELVKKTGAQGVEFKVVIKDGKAILRAVPK